MNYSKGQNRDQALLEQLRGIVMENLQKEDFGVQELAQTYGISRSQLHRKLKKLTKKTISRFIREIRLDEAQKMLQEDVGTVSEIAYKVGFSSPTYFNTCFRDYFGYPPGEAKYHEADDSDKIVRSSNGKNRKPFLIGLSAVLLLALAWLTFINYQNGTEDAIKEENSIEKSIAVLPFKNWSGDPRLEYVSDGMTDAVITRLSKIRDIQRVTPFSSVLRYKNTDMSILEIADELNVQYVLEGNFKLSGEDVQSNLNLIEVRTNKHLWSIEFNGFWKTDQIFEMQAEVAENVVRNIQVEMTNNELEAIQKFPTENKQAYDLYLQAEYLKSKDDAQNFEKAIELYEKAITFDQEFVDASIGLANTYILGGFLWGLFDEQEAWLKAKDILHAVLKHDNTNTKAHEQLFAGYFYYDWDFAKSEAYYKGKIPGITENHRWRRISTYYLIKTGRADKARRAVESNIDFDPSDRLQYAQLAETLLFLNEKERSSSILESYRPYFLDSFYHLIQTARIHYFLGEHEIARKNIKILTQNFSWHPPIVTWLELTYQEMDGKRKLVNQSLNMLKSNYAERTSGSPAWFLALYYCQIKDYDSAFK